MSFIIDKDPNSVKHSNALSQAKYSLTLDQQRLIALAIAESSQNRDEITRTQSVDVSTYAEKFNIDPRNAYAQVKKAANDLMHNTIKFPNNEEEWHWITRKAIYSKGDGRVEFSFTPEILEHINGLKGRYTWYEISRISGMTSVYAIRIFEMMMAWRGTGTFTLDVDKLKERLEIDDKYSSFGGFDKFVLQPAKNQIELRAGWFMTIDKIKKGRKIVQLRFTFIENPQKQLC